MTNPISVNLILNGQQVEARVSPDLFLIDFLRDERQLTSVKKGCDQGHCGTCTVIVDGKAVRSCIVKMSRLNGSRVETIEGLDREGELHALQAAFVLEGSVQCGYCTPGVILAAKALLDSNPNPSEQEIRHALKNNLCRCTGYSSIVKSVQRAAGLLSSGVEYVQLSGSRQTSVQAMGASLIGKGNIERVRGQTKYGDDLFEEGMLIGQILWSEYPHAEILGIETREALEVPGVELVLTAQDVPGVNRIGILRRDQPAIAGDKVRMIGDPVAAVFADTEEHAREARDRIRVTYRPLPAVFTPEDAAEPGAPLIHETGNLCHQAQLERGDVEKAFQEAAVVAEDTYTTPFVEHAFLEPECGLAIPEPDGGVTVKIGTQAAFDDQTQLSEALGLPPDKIRVIQIPMGGAFGGKEDIVLQFILALGAIRSGRPVKITLTRSESLRTHPKRHAVKMHYKTAASQDGHLLAVEAHTILDKGAYTSLGTDILENMLTFGAGPYYVPNLRLEAKAYFTNNITAGAMRGFGVPQVAFALESQMDVLARALKMDPFDFRHLNALDVGLPLASDHVLESSVGIKQTLRASQEKLHSISIPRSGKKIGIGVASSLKNLGYGHGVVEDAGAIVELTPEGHFLVRVGLSDFGQGALTAMAQIAAQALGTDYDQVEVEGADTRLAPATGPTTASRQTYLSGNAVVMACEDLKQRLYGMAAEELGVPSGEIQFGQGDLVHPQSGRRFKLADLKTPLFAEARYRSAPTKGFPEAPTPAGQPMTSLRTHWSYSFATHVAIVEVDESTGVVKVLKFLAAHDVGRAINPQIIAGQIAGGVVMGQGFALSEEFVVQNGINITNSLYRCHIPSIEDAPEVIPIIVEDPEPEGPFGAKGLGEVPTLPAAAAVINAIYDAVGVRITSLPANKARVLAAIKARDAVK